MVNGLGLVGHAVLEAISDSNKRFPVPLAEQARAGNQ